MLDTISDGLNVTELYIHNNGSDLVKSLLRDYASRLTGIADSYVTYTDSAVRFYYLSAFLLPLLSFVDSLCKQFEPRAGKMNYS